MADNRAINNVITDSVWVVFSLLAWFGFEMFDAKDGMCFTIILVRFCRSRWQND